MGVVCCHGNSSVDMLFCRVPILYCEWLKFLDTIVVLIKASL